MIAGGSSTAATYRPFLQSRFRLVKARSALKKAVIAASGNAHIRFG